MSEHEPEPFDAHSRRLCPDGECVGLIGPDGHCRVCGSFDPDGARGLGPATFAGGCAGEDEYEPEASGHHTGEHEEGSLTTSSDFDSRSLCPDGACVGVLGADGRCKECGRSVSAPEPHFGGGS